MIIQPIPRIVIRGEQKENSQSIELLLVSHSHSNGKAWFDRITTSGSAGSPQAVRQAVRLRLAHLCYEPLDGIAEMPGGFARLTTLEDNHNTETSLDFGAR
jgi:hypothetical protein